MNNRKTNLPPSSPADTGDNYSSRYGYDYSDDDIPEIDLPKKTDAFNVIPDEVPRRDGPGGEQGGSAIIDNQELPIGFTMALAQHSDILNKFARLTETEQAAIVNGARNVKSRDEMRRYVENMFRQESFRQSSGTRLRDSTQRGIPEAGYEDLLYGLKKCGKH